MQFHHSNGQEIILDNRSEASFRGAGAGYNLRLLQTEVFILGAVSAVSACRMDAAPALRDRNERGRGGGGWWVVGRMVGGWEGASSI